MMKRKIAALFLAFALLLLLTGCNLINGRTARLMPKGPYSSDGLVDGSFQGAEYDTGSYSLRSFSLTISETQVDLGETVSTFGQTSRTDDTTYYSGTATINADNTLSVVCTRIGHQIKHSGFGANSNATLAEAEAAFKSGMITEEQLESARRYCKGERIDADIPVGESASFTVQIDAEKKVCLVLELNRNGYKSVYTYHNSGTFATVKEYDANGETLVDLCLGKDGTPFNGEMCEYDDQGRVIRKQEYWGGRAETGYVTYEYDSAGRISCLKEYGGNEYDYSTDSYVDTSVTYLFEYDGNNQVIRATEIIYHDGKIYNHTVFEYYSYKDKEDNKIKKATYYGDNNRLEGFREYDTNGEETSYAWYTYNGPDLLYYEVEKGSNTVYYHPDGTPYPEDNPPEDFNDACYFGDNNQIVYENFYDADGRITRRIEHNVHGDIICEIFYNSKAKRTKMLRYYDSGAQQSVTVYTADGKEECVSYTEDGKLSEKTVYKGDDLLERWSYDNNGLLEEERYYGQDCSYKKVVYYTYHSNGNMYSKRICADYKEDPEEEGAFYPNTVEEYIYYENGNLQYEYIEKNRVPIKDCNYDENGNLIEY